MQKFSG